MRIVYRIFAVILASLFIAWLSAFLVLKLSAHNYASVSMAQRDQATKYLTGKLTPAPPEWQWGSFEPQAYVSLRTGYIDAKDAKGTVVIVPGFTGTIEMIMREIVRINAAGYRVAAIEYRGQGASWRPLDNPEKGYVNDYGELAADIAAFANSVKTDSAPLFFYSISKGAHITMRMAAEHQPPVAAYALMVPMIQINTGDFPYNQVRAMATVLDTVGLGSLYAPGQKSYTPPLQYGNATPCNSNPETAQTQDALFALNESLRTRGSTLRWLRATMSSTEMLLDADYVSQINAPIKLFTAGIDHLVNSDVAAQFCDSLQNCEHEHIASAHHCITEEEFGVYDELIDQVIDHFDRHAAVD